MSEIIKQLKVYFESEEGKADIEVFLEIND